jgi:hypothetical protein
VDVSVEQNILTASIISTKFLEEMYPLYDKQYLTNSFITKVMNWVLDYFDRFGEAPKQHIQDIFTIEKQTLEDAELDLIQSFLENLSQKYTEDQGINEAYVLHQTMEYFRRRELEVRIANASALLQIGRLDKAEEEISHMKKVMKLTSNWVNPFDTESITKVFDESNQGIFKFPGKFGELLGEFERGWFVAFLAPFKRGKTWFLMEAAVLGALSGLKTVFISLEMQEKAVNQRIYKRITAYGEEGRDHFIPVFDCRNNQLGLCIREERKGKGALAEKEEGIPTYSPEIQHTVCTACRYAKNSDYSPMTWFEPVDKPKFIEKNVRKGIKAFAKMYGDNIRVKCYPRFSAGIDDIERDLDILEQTEGFLPDMIVIDYVDILKVKNGNGGHKDLDEIWKESASLFARRFALGFSASQGTRGSLYKSDMDQTDLAEWIGKLGHVDAFVALNQTKKEKLLGMIRAALMAHRHKEFSEDENVILLQALSLGQTHLDSHIK